LSAGLLQLTFTVIALVVFQPIYHFKALAVLWQVSSGLLSGLFLVW
jgi:hypothetical protein